MKPKKPMAWRRRSAAVELSLRREQQRDAMDEARREAEAISALASSSCPAQGDGRSPASGSQGSFGTLP
jgi:hypothetical protein